MEMEIEELRRQRDLAQTQVDELRRKLQEDQQVSFSHTFMHIQSYPYIYTHVHFN